jgi:WD40 repeat protein
MIFEKIDGHKSQIYAMTSVDNLLYSSAAKSLKIWDLETMKYISDLPEKIGLVKSMLFWKERKLLLTASEKTVMMWDVVSLTNVGSIKTNLKDEIKCMELVGNKLILGTKGT